MLKITHQALSILQFSTLSSACWIIMSCLGHFRTKQSCHSLHTPAVHQQLVPEKYCVPSISYRNKLWPCIKLTMSSFLFTILLFNISCSFQVMRELLRLSDVLLKLRQVWINILAFLLCIM